MTTTTMRAVAGELRGEQATWDLENLGGEGNFLNRLMDLMGWTRVYARRAIAEYQRYCELAGSCGHPVTPSTAVDQVWHLHLLDTRHYWQRFCPTVLGRELHHTPSRRGRSEATFYHEQYAQTLRSYQLRYGHAAPADIWPPPRQRFACRERMVDLQHCWVIRKPDLIGTCALLTVLALLLLLIPIKAHAAADTLTSNSAPLLVLLVSAVAVVLSLVWRARLRSSSTASQIRLPTDEAELAFLASGAQRATDVVLVRLLRDGLLETEDASIRRSATTNSPTHTDPLDNAVWDALRWPHSSGDVRRALEPHWLHLREQHLRRGLRCLPEQDSHRLHGLWWVPTLTLLAAWLVGAIQFGDTLLAVLIAAIALLCSATVLLPRLGSTAQTRAALAALIARHSRLRNAPCRDEWPLAVALYGVVALESTPLASFYTLRKQEGGSSCGTGCADSSGGGCGGDGGCGGGCGGCG